MTDSTAPTAGADRARPEPIRAVPVRHPGRWVAIAVIAVLTAMFVHLLVTNSAFQWRFMVNHMFTPPVLRGVLTTLELTLASMALGILLGTAAAVMRLSPNPILSWVSWLYTWFFRAVPRLVLLTLAGNLGILWGRVEVGVPFDHEIGLLFGIHDLKMRVFGISSFVLLRGFMAGWLALSLSEGAYMAEIVRAGMNSIDPGQTEAAQALGMRRPQVLRRILLPQAMRVIVPPTGNEVIAMLKDTSLVIAVPIGTELFFQLQQIGNRTYAVFPMLVAACLWYLAMTSVLMVGQYFLEKYFSRGYGTKRVVFSRRQGKAKVVDQ
jgi:polar amino acid transport system permease protein